MEFKAKYKIGNYVYYIDKRKGIRGGMIKSSCIENSFFGKYVIYSIRVVEGYFRENELYENKQTCFRYMCNWLCLKEEKVDLAAKILFPDEVTEADFNTVALAPEPLQIPERTGFFKNLFK